jgi:ribosomal protein S18 acetylase RimI-like enzyme
VEIREVRPEEYAEAGQVTALAYSEFAREPHGWDSWDEYLAMIADVEARADRTLVLGAFDEGGRVLGTVTLELDDVIGDDDTELPEGTSVIRMLGVDPARRGTGIGLALVEACIARARRGGKSVISLRTTSRMTAAQRVYSSVGFERDPARDMHFEDGISLMAFRLEL